MEAEGVLTQVKKPQALTIGGWCFPAHCLLRIQKPGRQVRILSAVNLGQASAWHTVGACRLSVT